MKTLGPTKKSVKSKPMLHELTIEHVRFVILINLVPSILENIDCYPLAPGRKTEDEEFLQTKVIT